MCAKDCQVLNAAYGAQARGARGHTVAKKDAREGLRDDHLGAYTHVSSTISRPTHQAGHSLMRCSH